LFLFLLLCFSLTSLAIYSAQFRFAVTLIRQLAPQTDRAIGHLLLTASPLISVIVPAYNEEENIEDCITSILDSTKLSALHLELWVVDDQSTDHTWAILNALQQKRQDPRLNLLMGLPRPDESVWIGKNWACTQAAECSKGRFLLFIDADVRLKLGAIESVLQRAEAEQIDLLNCIPEVVCGSLLEWLVQPLLMTSLVITFAQPAVQDPHQAIAYAAGPFMLLRRSAYDRVGGHRAVSNQVAEDVALARAMKRHHFKLQYYLGAELARLRMYTAWAALWEGWTKVLYVGAWRNIGLMGLLIVTMLSLYTLPWVGCGLVLINGFRGGWSLLDGLSIGLGLLCLILQYHLRAQLSRALYCPPKYWWLQSLSGILIAVMVIVSVIKAETGWGWTWRGRSLR
jgi:hypothetical protein